MWDTDPKSTTIDQAYEPLLAKAANFDNQWSIAELRLSDDDVHWLEDWFSSLKPDHSLLYPSGEKLGALLLCLGAELCRENSTEDSIWPTIRGILPKAHPFLSQLFLSNGQPSHLTKWIVVDAARSLNLRNAFDIEGTQQWFTTVKLQFGFTYHGAQLRLAEWLVGLGQPHAVQYLNGEAGFRELKSRSFGAMWMALRQLRREDIDEITARQSLLGSPWVKSYWIDDLLKETQARIDILGRDSWTGTERGSHEVETTQEGFCPIEAVSLDWKPGSIPRLMFDLDCAAIENRVSGTSISELDFSIDGLNLCRWVRQGDGSWNGTTRIAAEPDRRLNQPNLAPKVLTARSRSGEPVIEWDFADSDLSSDVVVFDLDGSRMVDFGTERLVGNRHYAVLCEKDCTVRGCVPTQEFVRDSVSRRAVRLPVPVERSVAIAYEDFVLWQPVESEGDQSPRFSLILRTACSQDLRLNDQAEMIVEGIPDEATDAALLIHKKTYDLIQEDLQRRTVKAVTVTPEFAAKQRRVRVKFSLGGRKYTVEPRLSLGLLGVAMIRHKRSGESETIAMEPLRTGEVINTSEGTKWLRIWTPGGHGHTSVLEGDHVVGRLRNSRISLRDIPGFGGELSVSDEDGRYLLGVWCQNRGCVRGGEPAILGSSATLFLLTEKDPNESGYVVYEWAITSHQRAALRGLPHEAVRGASSRRWRVECSADLMALALSYKGSWLGAWWTLDGIKHYVQNAHELRLSEYSALRWLHVPILAPELEPALRGAIQRTPLHFVNAWVNHSELPQGIHHSEDGFDTFSILRHFLWNEFPAHCRREAIKTIGRCNPPFEEVRCRKHLGDIADISPVLLWDGIEQCGRKCENRFHFLLQIFQNSQIDLPKDAGETTVFRRLSTLQDRASDVTRLGKERLQEVCKHRIRSLEASEKLEKPLTDLDRHDLLRLGATLNGRRYIAAHVAQHFLSQPTK